MDPFQIVGEGVVAGASQIAPRSSELLQRTAFFLFQRLNFSDRSAVSGHHDGLSAVFDFGKDVRETPDHFR